MRKIIAILVGAMLCAFIAPTTMAGPTDTIVVTLTPGMTANITVTPGTWDGESAAVGAAKASSLATDFNLSNVGTGQVSVDVKATDTAAWTLAGTAGHDAFVLETDGPDVTLTTSDQDFVNALPAEGGGVYYEEFGLSVTMPTTSSVSAAQETTITFTATLD